MVTNQVELRCWLVCFYLELFLAALEFKLILLKEMMLIELEFYLNSRGKLG